MLKAVEDPDDGDELYPGDIAVEYRLDSDQLRSVMDAMLVEGHFRLVKPIRQIVWELEQEPMAWIML